MMSYWKNKFLKREIKFDKMCFAVNGKIVIDLVNLLYELDK